MTVLPALQCWRWLLPLLALLATPALAIDYRSISEAAVLYDAPSQKGKKLHVILAGTPVEIVVSVGAWIKIRDADGTLAWVEKPVLSEQRTVIVRAPRTSVRRSADTTAPVSFEAAQQVVLELIAARSDGWAQVKHASGRSGFIRSADVWGL